MDAGPVGRDSERAAIAGFLRRAKTGPAALVLEGDPGIGKSVLWKDTLRRVHGRTRVSASAPSSSELDLAFAVLGDLLEPLDSVIATLAEARRHALEIALALREPSSSFPSAGAPLATLDVIRGAASEGPLLIAIDDAHWIDTASTRALAFALHRIVREPVGILLTARPNVDDATPDILSGFGGDLRHVRLGPLDIETIAHLVADRVDPGFSRALVARIHEQSGGNPFYALELARAVVRRGDVLRPSDPLPMPQSLRAAMTERLDALAPAAQRVVTLAACARRPTVRLIAAVDPEAVAEGGIDAAMDAGVIDVTDEAMRFVHPLVSAAAIAGTTHGELRRIHAALADAVNDPVERGQHLAEATTVPDAGVAGQLDAAAIHAARRGARESAGMLAEDALRLTPDDRPDDADARALSAIDNYVRAGDYGAATRIIEARLPGAPAGTPRAALLVRLGMIRAKRFGFADAEGVLLEAAAESSVDARLRSEIEFELGIVRRQLGDMSGAGGHAEASLAFARETGDPSLIADARIRLAGFRFVSGAGVPSATLAAMRRIENATPPDRMGIVTMMSTDALVGFVLKGSDRFDEAHAVLERSYRRAIADGHDDTLSPIVAHLSELAFWTGDWDEAERLARLGIDLADAVGQRSLMTPLLEYCLASVAAARGDVVTARELGEHALRGAEAIGDVPFALLAGSALAALDLALGDPVSSHRRLGVIAGRVASMRAEGEPGILRFMADAIEAAVAVGELDEAERLTDYFEGRGRDLDRPFALATGARCRALLLAARGDVAGALEAIDRALVEHERLGMPLELGRTLLVAGTTRRRAKQKRASREALEAALAIFDELGAKLWAERARTELERVVVHATAADELTPTEERVAGLVASGRTNREVAAALSISVKTVDSNLTRIYRKLGVRSRTELARAFLLGDPSDSTRTTAT